MHAVTGSSVTPRKTLWNRNNFASLFLLMFYVRLIFLQQTKYCTMKRYPPLIVFGCGHSLLCCPLSNAPEAVMHIHIYCHLSNVTKSGQTDLTMDRQTEGRSIASCLRVVGHSNTTRILRLSNVLWFSSFLIHTLSNTACWADLAKHSTCVIENFLQHSRLARVTLQLTDQWGKFTKFIHFSCSF